MFEWLGTTKDMIRRAWRRVDSELWRNRVKNARIRIFNIGRSVAGTAVDNLLKAHSWVPVEVSYRLSSV
jgi:hypothetical protein